MDICMLMTRHQMRTMLIPFQPLWFVSNHEASSSAQVEGLSRSIFALCHSAETVINKISIYM